MDINYFVEDILKEDSLVTDIHFIPKEKDIEIYLRTRSNYKFYKKIDMVNYKLFIQKTKVLAGMDISEKRLPQDGVFDINNKKIRVSTLFTLYGEALVYRIFNDKFLKIEDLGLDEETKNKLLEILNSNFSLILVSGETGSGKSTTLKAILEYLSRLNKKVISIEDPIETISNKITQIAINEQINFTYEKAIFASMRQDPDYIAIGEVRDSKTAMAIIKAALSGHPIISTIHSSDFFKTLKRLELLTGSDVSCREILSYVINQRLITEENKNKVLVKLYKNDLLENNTIENNSIENY